MQIGTSGQGDERIKFGSGGQSSRSQGPWLDLEARRRYHSRSRLRFMDWKARGLKKIFMPLLGRTVRRRHNVLELSVRLFVCLLHNLWVWYVENESTDFDSNRFHKEGHEVINFGVRRSKVNPRSSSSVREHTRTHEFISHKWRRENNQCGRRVRPTRYAPARL